MIIFLSFLLLTLAVSPAYAHLHGDDEQDKVFNYPSPEDSNIYQGVEHEEEYYGCSGYLRAGFIQTEIRSVDTASASALTGEFGCGYRFNPHIKAHFGLFGVLDTGLNSRNDDNIHTDFFNRKKDSYLMLGEAVLTLSYGNFEAHLGRQNLNSPHFDGDDLRMVANLFEAYLLDYHPSHALSFGAGLIREAAGWENGGELSHFIPVGEALGGKHGLAWSSWVTYEEAHFSSNLWFYFIPNHLTIVYGEWGYRDALTTNIDYDVALQYDWGHQAGQARLGEVDAHTLGFTAALSGYDFTLTAAFNKNLGHTGAVASVGGGPFFTSMEDQTLDAVTGDDPHSLLFSVEYSLNNTLDLGVAAAEFRAVDKKDYHVEEVDFFINYNWNDQFTAEFMYAVIDDKHSSEDTHQVRAIFTYRY